MRRFLIMLSCAIAFCGFALAQSESASLSGRVSDPSGAAIVGADITIMNTETNVLTRTKSNGTGDFGFPTLIPGPYRLTVHEQGFQQSVTERLVLHVQDRISQNVSLAIGASDETVTVTADAQQINTQDATVGTVVERQIVANMPLNGRSFQGLITLTPGVTTVATNANTPGQFVVNGQRSETNYFTVDGVSANAGAPTLGSINANGTGATPTSTATGGFNNMVSIDALQEFRISTSSFAPEFGRSPGGQVSLVSRGGTNVFHGDVFDYFRNTVLDTNDWFLNASGKPRGVVQQNDFGGVVGGPIIKNKAFFFGSYEGLRLQAPSPAVKPVPTQDARAQAAAASTNGTTGYMAQFLNSYPLPDGNPTTACISAATCIANYTATLPGISRLDASSVRIDYNLNTRMTLFGRYSHSPSTASSGNTVSTTNFQDGNDVYTAGWTYAINNSIANDAHFNFTHTSFVKEVDAGGFKGDFSTIFPTGFAQPPSSFALQDMAIQLGGFNGGLDTFIMAPTQANNGNDQINITDSVSITKASHVLKFGADFRQLNPTYDQVNFNWNNQFAGTSNCPGGLPAYICGLASLSNIQHNTPQHFQFREYSFFAQDTWKATQRLTLTYGLRWEINPAVGYTNGRPGYSVNKSSFNLSTLQNVTLNPFGDPAYQTRWGNVSPRIGVAYQLSTDPRWGRVLRAGYGLFYDTGQSAFAVAGSPWGAATNNLTGGPSTVPFPITPTNSRFVTPPDLSLATPINTSSANLIDPNYNAPYVHEVNLTLEQQLGTQQSFTVSYVGALGRHLVGDLIYPPNKANASLIGNNGVAATLFVFGNYADSEYHSLQAKFQRQFTHGLGALASYTWSHSIDNASQGTNNATSSLPTAATVASGLPFTLLTASSDFDIRHALGASLVYDLPSPTNPIAKAVLGHWSVDPIYHYQSSPPIDIFANTVSSLGGATNLGQRPNLIPGVPIYVSGPACAAQYLAIQGVNGCPGGRALNIAPVTPAAAASAGCAAPTATNAKGAFCTPLPVGKQAVSGNLGRNAVRGFPLQEFDLSVHREFPIHESVRLRFQADMFNVFNHPSFGPEGFNMLNSSFGLTSSMANAALSPGLSSGAGFSPIFNTGGPRNFQFALKLFF